MLSPLLNISSSCLIFFVRSEQILGVAGESHFAQRVHTLDTFPQPLFQAVAEALAGLSRPSKLDGELLARGCFGLRVRDPVPRGDGERKHVALTV